MKKIIYLLLTLLSATPSMATQKVATSLIVASTLLVSNKYDKNLSLDLHKAIEKNDYTLAHKLMSNPQVDINAKVDYGTSWRDKLQTPLIRCCKNGDTSLGIAGALLARKDINVNVENKRGYTPLDKIIKYVLENEEYYQYVKLWKVLVAKGAILSQCTTDYQKLNPNNFKEPQRSYIQSIKHNPP